MPATGGPLAVPASFDWQKNQNALLMKNKLLLYSFELLEIHARELNKLAGKSPEAMRVALIENAADVEPALQEWLPGIREKLKAFKYQVETVDLRDWKKDKKGLAEKLESKDVFCVSGGNTFYLRWIMKETGADEIIRRLTSQGKVYAGWSAGAIVAGPKLKHFDLMDDPKAAPETITEGLELTDVVVVPHKDNDHFAESSKETNRRLLDDGFNVVFLNDDQAVISDGSKVKTI